MATSVQSMSPDSKPLLLNCWPLTPVWSCQHQGRWESWKHWLKVHMSSQSSEAQPVSAPSLYIDHTLIRWSLDPAASSLCLGSRWSEKATLCTMLVWYWSTARGRSFFHPKTRTRWSQPADARSLPSPLIHSWETPGLTSVTQSWSCKNTERKRIVAGLCRLVHLMYYKHLHTRRLRKGPGQWLVSLW